MPTELLTGATVGEGSAEANLSPADLTAIVREALSPVQSGERVLAIISDKTRDDNTDVLFPAAAEYLNALGVRTFDALVAQGTHPPMTPLQKLQKIGSANEFTGTVFDHR